MRRPLLVGLAGLGAGVLAVPLLTTAATASSTSGASAGRAAIAAGRPAWATAAADRGAVPASQELALRVVLNLRDEAGAEQEALAVSTPGNAAYGKFLTPDQFRAAYAPTNAQVAAVEKYLSSAGFTIGSVPSNHRYVEVTGTAKQAAAAFDVALHGYAHDGQVVRAPAGQASLPRSIASLVAGVGGLSQTTLAVRPNHEGGNGKRSPAEVITPASAAAPATTPAPSRLGDAPGPGLFRNARPCSAYYGQKLATDYPKAYGKTQPFAPCGYIPSQLQGAYGVDKLSAAGIGGQGVTVAITDAYAAPTIESDANTYFARHGVAPFAKGQLTQLTPSSYRYGYDDKVHGDLCGEQGWYGEETLDVEAVHGVAPGAHVLYVASRSCLDNDFVDALNKIVDNKLANVISNSWGDLGEPDPATQGDLLQAYQQTFVQAATQGIGVFFSSGDSGDDVAATGVRTADFPPTNPFVTAVGGTSLEVGNNARYETEYAWGTGRSTLSADGKTWTPTPPGNYLYGSGGGTSRVYRTPGYQQGGVVPNRYKYYFHTGTPGRVVPDIAAVGDPNTGFLVGETQSTPNGTQIYSEYRIGGTSVSSPVFAGIEAISDQAYGRSHGFANPALYRLAGTSAFRDITPQPPTGDVRIDYANFINPQQGFKASLRSFADLQSLSVAKGYDDSTGLGTPNGTAFVNGLGYGQPGR